jgi:hypothetical protein
VSDTVECKACDAGLPLVRCVQSQKMVHLRGLDTITCDRVRERDRREAHDRMVRDIANDRGNEDQRGR